MVTDRLALPNWPRSPASGGHWLAGGYMLSSRIWRCTADCRSTHACTLQAEIRYACRRELAATAVDVVARRIRLAFLNTYAATEALPRIIEVMAAELKWDKKVRRAQQTQTVNVQEAARQLKMGMDFIDNEMGQMVRGKALTETPINLTHEEMQQAKRKFAMLDKSNRGEQKAIKALCYE
jgi:hypothetical protein